MQATHLWNQLHLHRSKVGLLVFLFFGSFLSVFSQGLFGLTSVSGSDDKFLSYGFFLNVHTSTYQLKYSEAFFDPNRTNNNAIQSIYPKYTPGFSLGFTGILRIHDQFNVLLTPKIGFYEYRFDVNSFQQTFPQPGNNTVDNGSNLGYSTKEYVNEATLVEIPLLFKYRSQRFNNTRMYFIGGASYNIRTKSQDEANIDPIVTTGRDFSLEAGMGFEVYFRFFKFAPEIRFSHGLNNLYFAEKTPLELRDAISSIKRKNISIYLNFQ
jgi:hypothetical protein